MLEKYSVPHNIYGGKRRGISGWDFSSGWWSRLKKAGKERWKKEMRQELAGGVFYPLFSFPWHLPHSTCDPYLWFSILFLILPYLIAHLHPLVSKSPLICVTISTSSNRPSSPESTYYLSVHAPPFPLPLSASLLHTTPSAWKRVLTWNNICPFTTIDSVPPALWSFAQDYSIYSLMCLLLEINLCPILFGIFLFLQNHWVFWICVASAFIKIIWRLFCNYELFWS